MYVCLFVRVIVGICDLKSSSAVVPASLGRVGWWEEEDQMAVGEAGGVGSSLVGSVLQCEYPHSPSHVCPSSWTFPLLLTVPCQEPPSKIPTFLVRGIGGFCVRGIETHLCALLCLQSKKSSMSHFFLKKEKERKILPHFRSEVDSLFRGLQSDLLSAQFQWLSLFSSLKNSTKAKQTNKKISSLKTYDQCQNVNS